MTASKRKLPPPPPQHPPVQTESGPAPSLPTKPKKGQPQGHPLNHLLYPLPEDFVDVARKDDDICFFCLDGAETARIIWCDGCHKGYCLECLGLREVPTEEPWYCYDCKAGHHVCRAPWCNQAGPPSSSHDMDDNDGGLVRCCAPDCNTWYHKHCVRMMQTLNAAAGRQGPFIRREGGIMCPGHVCASCLLPASEQHGHYCQWCIRCRHVWHNMCGGEPMLEDSEFLVLCSECRRTLPREGALPSSFTGKMRWKPSTGRKGSVKGDT